MQVTDEEKKALLGGAGYFNDYVIKFPSVTITIGFIMSLLS